MLISAKNAPILFMCLRIWNKSDELVPIIRWFNPNTMIASVPTDIPNSELRTEIGRFEFVVHSEYEEVSLRKVLSHCDEKELFERIEVVLED